MIISSLSKPPPTKNTLPAIGFGCMGLGGRYTYDNSSDNLAIEIIHDAFELGARLFDTAEVYGGGHSEELLGRASASKRKDFFIATKFSAEHAKRYDVFEACERSLKRLDTDYIDLYQCHWPNPEIPFSETIDAMKTLQKEGKILNLGFSNLTAKQLLMVSQLAVGSGQLFLQQEYSLFERTAEHTILPFCQENNISLIAYSPLGQGKRSLSSRQHETLKRLTNKYNLSRFAVMLCWLTHQPNVLAIPMTSSRSHLMENMKALSTKLDENDYEQISQTFKQNLKMLNTLDIDVVGSHTGKIYTSLEDALNNSLALSPSPRALANELRDSELLKPIKVRASVSQIGRYELYEGQSRYWAWVIAHKHQKPILAQVD